jgi:hypothetical protein
MTTTQKMRPKYVVMLILVIEGKCTTRIYTAIKSSELKAIIVEQILVVCVNRTRFYELFDTLRRITSFSRYTLKKYLFLLIEYGIISYQVENQVYVITRQDWNYCLLWTERKGQHS